MNSYVFPPIDLQAVLDAIKERSIELFGDKLARIILYGSYARGDFRNDSDVDLMILLDCSESEVAQMEDKSCQMANDIGWDYDALITVFLMDAKHFDDNKTWYPFYQNIVKDGVVIYDKQV